MLERGATIEEVVATVETGEGLPARLGRSCFRRNFPYNAQWRGKRYANKQVQVIAVPENDDWLVITVMVKFF